MASAFARAAVVMIVAAAIPPAWSAPADTLDFAGFRWTVRSGKGGPGPNTWDRRNAWLDASGHLHLKLVIRDGIWTCAEVTLQRRLGFGRYEFEVEGPLDRLDENVVLGLFNYPPRDVGEDATREIDIEFARWGNARHPIGNYTVWPVDKALKQTTRTFDFSLTSSISTHRFEWKAEQVSFRSWQGTGEGGREIFRWEFRPADADRRLARQPMPVHFNLWLFQGQPPRNGQEVEVILRGFRFAPG